MSQEHFSTRLKIYSNRLFRFFSLSPLLVCLIVAACASQPRPVFKEKQLIASSPTPQSREEPKPLPVPPWQIWSSDSMGDLTLERAEQFAADGKLREAADLYRLVEQQSPSPVIQESALLRRVGTMLKIGESKEALSAVTSFLQARGRSIEDLRPHLSYVVSYAYLGQGDRDQALAWLSLTYRHAGAGSELWQRAKRDAAQIIRGFAPADFDRYEARWVNDPSIGPMFAKERERRIAGAAPEIVEVAKWFNPALYHPGALFDAPANYASGVPFTESALAQENGEPVPNLIVGILLPLSGKFAEHGKRVKEGIEFAFQEYQAQGGVMQVVVGDTGGDADTAVREYLHLVQEDRATFVFGPLLVKSAIAVAQQSKISRIPLLTFSKREGIPEMSPYVFRLGATARNQVAELLKFAVQREGLKTFAAMYPISETGTELVEAFRQEAPPHGATLTVDIGYDPGDRPGLERAIKELETSPPQALFVADSLESTWPILEVLQSSPLRDIPIFGPAAWDDPVALRGYASLLENAVYVTPFFAQSSDPEIRAFAQRFSGAFNHEPGLLGAQGYDAARLFLSSLQPGDFSAGSLKKNLELVDGYIGVTGKLQVQPQRDIMRRMSVVRLVRGEPQELIVRGEPTGYLIDEESTKVGAVSTQ